MCFKVDLGAVVRMLEHMNTANEPSDFRVEHLNCKSNARHKGFNFNGELSNEFGWVVPPESVDRSPNISSHPSWIVQVPGLPASIYGSQVQLLT